MVSILPFVEQDNLRRSLDPWSSGFFANYNKPVKTFVCPSDPRQSGQTNTSNGGLTNYVGVTGSDTTWQAQYNGPSNGFFNVAQKFKGLTLVAATDGTSNTLLVGERPPAQDLFWGWWAVSDYDNLLSTRQLYSFYSGCVFPGTFRPGLLSGPCNGDSNHFWSFHTNGANWAMGDGSVRFMPYTAQPVTFPMATASGGETFTNDF
jgi:prepilin-type processing-associated H-X9-DG protein